MEGQEDLSFMTAVIQGEFKDYSSSLLPKAFTLRLWTCRGRKQLQFHQPRQNKKLISADQIDQLPTKHTVFRQGKYVLTARRFLSASFWTEGQDLCLTGFKVVIIKYFFAWPDKRSLTTEIWRVRIFYTKYYTLDQSVLHWAPKGAQTQQRRGQGELLYSAQSQ